MQVTGPAWPSTAALKAALANLQSDTVLRWGQGGKNGLEQLRCFTEAGLACPEFTTDINVAKGWARAGTRTFGRRLHHTQGFDIVGAGYKARAKRGQEHWNPQWLRRDFWVKVIDSVAEYRQHVWDGRAIRIGKKVEAGEHHRIQPVRSRNNGWHIDYAFKSGSENFTQIIRTLAKAAVEALGYQGGAVDILEGRDNKLYVLEVNSAPALTDANTLAAYVRAITRQVKKVKTPRR